MEPMVSVPKERGANPAATATTGPVEEPPGDFRSQWMRVWVESAVQSGP
jgi:hypothetical protein